MKWHEMSINQKKQMIEVCWNQLDISHMSLLLDPCKDEDNAPVDRDGFVDVRIREWDLHLTIKHIISYRSIHSDNQKYIKHILKTIALDLAKQYYNIPREIL